jgi:predicted nucleic acid-binding protein
VIVLDTSAVVDLFIDGPRRDSALRALRQFKVQAIPPLWRSEFRSALLKYVSARRLDVAAATRAFQSAETRLSRIEVQPSTRRVLEAAVAFRLSSYDAEYIALAQQLGAMVLTADGRTLADRVPSWTVRLSSFDTD